MRYLHSCDPFEINKIPEYWTAAIFWTYHPNLLENRHLEDTNYPYCFVPCGESKKDMCKCKRMNYLIFMRRKLCWFCGFVQSPKKKYPTHVQN